MTTIADRLILLARMYQYYEDNLDKRLELKGNRVRDFSALEELEEATKRMEQHISAIEKTFESFKSFNLVKDKFIN